jgi:hypothetical protein
MPAYPAVRVASSSLALVLAAALAGCGGDAPSDDAGTSPDAFVPPGADAAVPPADDAAVPPDAAMPPVGTVSFRADVEPILTANCTGSRCHSSPSTFFNGTARTGCRTAPDTRMVVPGSAATSYVVLKIEGTAPCGMRMPLGRTPLSAAQITTIRTWIDEGASTP